MLILYSCTSPENKAKKVIKEELKLTLHDFKSYEPVQFGKLELSYSNYEDLSEVQTLLTNSEEFLSLCNEYRDKADIYDSEYSRDKYWIYSAMATRYLDSAKANMDKINYIKLHFVSEVNGWKITHSYRAKSLGGNLGIHHYTFYLDKELKRVTKTVDVSEK